MISSKIKKIDSSQIQTVYKLASSLKNPIDLSIGVPFGHTPNPIKEAAIKAINENLTRYTPPEGIKSLIASIFKKLKKDNKLLIKNEASVMVIPGVTVGLFVVYLILFNPNDELILFDPYFPVYLQLCNILGIRYKLISTYPNFEVDLAKIENVINKNTKAILLNSPNNPTGIIYSKEIIKEIVKIARKHNLILISDEIYEDFCYTQKPLSPGSLYPNTITLNGFSKSFAMSGFRIGYLAGPEKIIQAAKKIAPYTYFSNSSIAQHAALEAIETDNSSIISEHKKRRNLAVKLLSQKFEIHGADGAFYLFLKAPDGDGDKFVEKAVKKNLLLLPGSLFSSRNTHFRISYATSIKQLKEGITVLNSLS